MKRAAFVGILMTTFGAAWALAQSTTQQPPPNPNTIADYAKKLQEQQQKANQASTTPAKVYTNDDVERLRGAGGVTVASAPLVSKSEPASEGAHDAKYYQKAYGKLQAQKQLHERELEVLQEQLAQNQIQWYPDPNKQLEQQSTPKARSDINKLQSDVNAKKLEIQNDDQAISDLQDQLRRDGGDAGWLREGAPAIESLSAEKVPTTKTEKNTKDKKKTKEYWQARFRPARANLKSAEEVQKLLQNEVQLLEKRKLIEQSPEVQTEIDQKLASRQAELETANDALEKARKELDDLQRQFDESGAPQEWSVTED